MPHEAPSPRSSIIVTVESFSTTGVKKNSLVSNLWVADVRVNE